VLSARGGADDFFDVADAEVGEVRALRGDFVAHESLGLEAAERGGCLMEKTARLGAGAVDGGLAAIGVVEDGEGGFDEAAAAETPHGSEDFFGQVFFHQGDWAKLCE